MSIKIIENYPHSPKRGKYPFGDMVVGAGFSVPENIVTNLRQATISYAQRRPDLGLKFQVWFADGHTHCKRVL